MEQPVIIIIMLLYGKEREHAGVELIFSSSEMSQKQLCVS